MTQPAAPLATPPVIRAMLDKAREKNYRTGVLGVRARPEWGGPAEFDHQGVPVRVVPCGSTLAVREALLDRDPDGWLVVLTDRDETDLGYGLLGRLVWQRLRQPDPWDAVRQRFAASGIDPALTSGGAHRELANGLLAATPPDGWPPAPGGVLTRDHALAATARAQLGLGTGGPGADGLSAGGFDVDAAAVLRWSTAPEAATRLADLRALAGDPLADVLLDWVARRTGASAAPLHRLLAAGAVGDAVPLGLVARLLVAARQRGGDEAETARDALVRLESRLGPVARDLPALRAWGGEAEAVAAGAVAADLLTAPARPGTGGRLLARADALLRELAAEPLAAHSDLQPAGLTARLGQLAPLLRTAADQAQARAAREVDQALVPEPAAAAVAAAWTTVEAHRLAGGDGRRPAVLAAVRLVRWLATGTAAGPGLAAQLDRHRDGDAWVDSAVNDATAGVDDPELGSALAAVLAVVRRRRDAHDLAFAAALAAHTADDPPAEKPPEVWWRHYRGVSHLEDLLPDVVLPLARREPVLLLVMDGMSVAVATEVMEDLLSGVADSWVEAVLPGQRRRAAGLAVLPTLTDVSRTSLLCGDLRAGQQAEERRGYAELVRAHGLPDGTPLFHKRPLDESQPGYALAHDVAAAIDDRDGLPLVTCVLNAIDDALDRSDPAGTGWGREAIKHLRPLLERARRASRMVVLTADHGHVVERRSGTQRPHPGISSGRSRPGDGKPAGDGEVLLAGRRVLRHDHRAVLAVDERLRYGPLKAGYHGGAAPAEAVVPVCVLAPAFVPEGLGLRVAGPPEPAWWHASPVSAAPATVPTQPSPAQPAPAGPVPAPGARAPRTPKPPVADPAAPTLFDLAPEPVPPAVPAAPVPAAPVPAATVPPGAALADAVLRSHPYQAQRRLAQRLAVDDRQVRELLLALLDAPGHRLPPQVAAAALQVSPAALRGALAHVFRLLNVEGYPVVALDPDGATVVLDQRLLREQFEVPA